MSTIGEHPTEALLDGRYRLGACIGRGGTAAVYRADDTILGRTVAIKLLMHTDEMPDAGAARVHSETAVLASLNHPSLVTLYDARLEPGGPRYLVMEYVAGPNLAALITRGPLPAPQVATLARDLAGALQVVHDAGIIHRDVKPSNVLLAPPLRSGTEWTAKLTDFGIAFGLDDARRTSPGVVVGTAAYMAPEQVRAAELTPAVDVYSLGLVLIEALTGESAFPVSGGGVQAALSHLTAPPAIPDSVGPGWTELLTRMTRIDPAARPTAREVASAATALGGEHPVADEGAPPDDAAPTVALAASAPPPVPTDDHETAPTREYTAPIPAASRPSRMRRVALAALGVACAVTLSTAALTGLWDATPPAGSRARLEVPDPSVTPQPTPEVSAPAAPSGPGATTGDTGKKGGSQGSGNSGESGTSGDDSGSNPNKGPGENSGSSDRASKSGKDE